MPDEQWPDPTAPYEFAARSVENARRWKAAIDKAIEAGSLRLEQSGERYRTLVGACPRCGHAIGQELQFGRVDGLFPRKKRYSGIFNIRCNCTEPHTDRAGGTRGCGWGGPNPVNLQTE